VSHVYNSQGLYNVTLRGYNNNYNLIEEKTKNNYINVYQRIVADFSADNIVGVAPLIDVHFFDRSVPTATS